MDTVLEIDGGHVAKSGFSSVLGWEAECGLPFAFDAEPNDFSTKVKGGTNVLKAHFHVHHCPSSRIVIVTDSELLE